jgi:ATP-binding cassette subfamily B protein
MIFIVACGLMIPLLTNQMTISIMKEKTIGYKVPPNF